VTGSDEQLGKPSGSDERHGKVTYVSLYGIDRACELAKESHHKALTSLSTANGEVAALHQITDFIFTRTS
jgi:geranylgeranyl diphosphate synthase type II